MRNTTGKAGLTLGPIKFRQLWNCCWGKETHVITFDCGSRHAVCTRCANEYTRQNGPAWAADELADEDRVSEERAVICAANEGWVLDITPNDSEDGIDRSGILVQWSLGDSQTGDAGPCHYTWAQVQRKGFKFRAMLSIDLDSEDSELEGV